MFQASMKTYEDADGYAEIENHYGTWQDGLIDQLEFEGFTTSQAIYGVTQAGL